jgi:cell division protein FtsZ
MVRPGLINLDFADVRAVMDEMGKAMMGTGEAEGEDRAIQAAEKAIANPLLDEISLKGAKGVLINITGGTDLTLFELDEAANRIREEVDPDANIIVGSTLDTAMGGAMRVSVVATGIDASVSAHDNPVPRRSMAEPLTQTPAIEVSEEPEQVAYEEVQEVVAEAPEEPSFFDTPAQQPRQEAEPESTFFRSRRPMDEDELPEPAYNAAAQRGMPSPEAMARLQAAVRKSPTTENTQRVAADPRPQHAAAPAADRPRFGINSLINRMTGHNGEGAERPVQQVRRQPPVQAEPDEPELSADDERIEIPAFLRRQAN